MKYNPEHNDEVSRFSLDFKNHNVELCEQFMPSIIKRNYEVKFH